MRKYLICYYTEQNDVCTDLEKIVEAKSINSALYNFMNNHTYKRVTSISEIIDKNYSPDFSLKPSKI